MKLDYQWLETEVFKRPLGDNERQVLANAMEVIAVPPNMPIMHQGAQPSALFLLRSGFVNIVRKSGERETVVAARDNSKTFGEISLLGGEPVSASVIADIQCTVYKISRQNFLCLMQEHSALALDLMAFIVRNMGEVIRRLDARQANRH
ncbi:MAG: Crp/Fnr family transcriptional regulator [Mariprofundaceae bacterium]